MCWRFSDFDSTVECDAHCANMRDCIPWWSCRCCCRSLCDHSTHTHSPYLNSSQIMLKSMICMFSLHLNCSPRLFSILRYVLAVALWLCVRCTSARCTCSFRLFHVTWIAVTDSNAWIYNWKRRKRNKKVNENVPPFVGIWLWACAATLESERTICAILDSV